VPVLGAPGQKQPHTGAVGVDGLRGIAAGGQHPDPHLQLGCQVNVGAAGALC
jgi:hypothetical protein